MNGTTQRGYLARAGDWLAWLGGADRDVLKHVPGARDRFVQMALVLLTTASLAVVSMTFALQDALDVRLIPAILCGLFWGFVILNLDRFLVLSMGATRNVGHLFLMALPRLAMAVVLAAVISTPLVLRVFESDISAELSRYQFEQSKRQAADEPQTREQKELDEVNAQIKDYEAILDGNLPGAVSSPGLQAAQTKVDTLQTDADRASAKANRAYEAWQCELYGEGPKCRGASKRRGNGELAGAKRRIYLDAQKKADDVQGQLKAATAERDKEAAAVERTGSGRLATLQDEANAKLPDLRTRRDTLTASIRDRADDGAESNARDDGILAQLRALSRVGEEDSALKTAHWLVGALFFLIEILPVVVKILLNLTAPSPYEIKAALRDEELKDAAEIDRITARRVAEDKSEARIDIEHDMRDRERTIGKEANERVAEEMSAIVEAALREWSEQVQANLAAHGAQGGPGSSSGDPADDVSSVPPPPGRRFRRGVWPWQRAGAPAHMNVDDGYSMPSSDGL